MGTDIWGGGLIIAIAAGLWLVYLVPTWLRRREYLATERNALRLQQTMRILAETAELPQEVRLEMTARSVAAQERILRHTRERAEAETKTAEAQAAAEAAAAKAVAERAAEAAKAAAEAGRKVAGAAAASRSLLRRARAATSLVLLAAILAIGWGVYQLVVEASWLVIVVGAVVAGGAVLVLARLARSGRVRPGIRVPVPAFASPELYDHGQLDATEPVAEASWTPQPLPKPVYLAHSSAAMESRRMVPADAVAQLRRAAARADLELRAAQRSAEVAPMPVRPSRFASMGIVEHAPDASIDLDAVLRRRRAG